MVRKFLKAAMVVGAFAATPAWAAPIASIPVADSADTAWLLSASAFVLLMTIPGLALFYGGQVRAKNFVSVLVQTGAVAAVASLVWIIIGYSLAFSTDGGGYIGSAQNFMFNAMADVMRDDQTVGELVFGLFRTTTAILAPALIVGALAERVRFGWVIAFSALWSLLVFAPVSRWVWGNGALSDALDFAGGIVIFASAGVSALVAALMLGKRSTLTQGPIAPHNPAIALAGAGLLWVGWFGLSGGSMLSAGGDDAARAIINTHVAAAVAALTWILIERVTRGKVSAIGFASGTIAGLAAITSGADVVGPGGAFLIGLIAAHICYNIKRIVRKTLGIDDVCGVFALFGMGGITGAVLTAVFASEGLGGIGYTEDAGMVSQLWIQLKAVAMVSVWSAVATLIIGYMVAMVLPMRVREDIETEGLDVGSHGENG